MHLLEVDAGLAGDERNKHGTAGNAGGGVVEEEPAALALARRHAAKQVLRAPERRGEQQRHLLGGSTALLKLTCKYPSDVPNNISLAVA